MKHFEIMHHLGAHSFTYQCTTAYEALEALADLAIYDERVKRRFNADYYMELLVDMKNGRAISHQNDAFYIRYCDGEV